MKLAVPDLISNSYFPAAAAVELGFFAEEGLDIALELVYPVDKCYASLKDGTVDFVGGSAHSALAAFPEWNGAKLLCAQAQGMYWFLVLRADLGAKRGELDVVKGKSIGAAPWVDLGLKRLLVEAGSTWRATGSTSSRCLARSAPAPISASPRRKRWPTARSTGSGPTAWAPR